MSEWQKLLFAAEAAAGYSRDTTKVGALLVDSDGEILAADYNRFPDGVEQHAERWWADKLTWIEHAERNVIFAAARAGIATDGLTMVGSWAACADCARAIIQSGIRRLVRYELVPSPTWDASIAAADAMLREAGVEIVEVSWNPDRPTNGR